MTRHVNENVAPVAPSETPSVRAGFGAAAVGPAPPTHSEQGVRTGEAIAGRTGPGRTGAGRLSRAPDRPARGGTMTAQRRKPVVLEPAGLTTEIRAARTRRGLLSGEVALQSGVSAGTVVRVLAGDPLPPDRADADALLRWARTVLAEPPSRGGCA